MAAGVTPYYQDATLTAYLGDVRDVLRELEDESVHCVVTSPPYFGLRDYGVDGQIGLEATPAEFVAQLVAVFREVRRVLRKDGTLWLNLGDSYAAHGTKRDRVPLMPGSGAYRNSIKNGPSNGRIAGWKPKDRLGVPHRVVFALQDDGWWWRDEIVWHKPNPMPSSVTDRTTPAHEFVFLFARSRRYAYDADAIAEPAVTAAEAKWDPGTNGLGTDGSDHAGRGRSTRRFGQRRLVDSVQLAPDARPPGTAPQVGLHRATERNVGGRRDGFTRMPGGVAEWRAGGVLTRNKRSVWTIATQPFPGAHFATFPEGLVEPCILAGSPPDGVVLDPFGGAGTVALVANRLGRRAIHVDLNPAYMDIALRRVRAAWEVPA